MPTSLPLTEPQSETLRAAVNRIIPANDWPDGWGAGVGDYFAHLLTREPPFLFPLQQGLDALDAEARAAEGAAFAALTSEAQDAVLTRVEAGDTQADWAVPAPGFFRRLVQQTMEGYYADPGNGGNRDGVAWRMVGYRVTA